MEIILYLYYEDNFEHTSFMYVCIFLFIVGVINLALWKMFQC